LVPARMFNDAGIVGAAIAAAGWTSAARLT
jgi:hypothetical protein